MKSLSDERRRYPRSRRALTGYFDHSGPGVLNHIDNVSANGVLCHTVKPVPMMTKMSVVLELPHPEGHRIEAEGIVVRCDPDAQGDDKFRVAILFTKLRDEDHHAIREFVDEDLAAMEEER